MFEVNTQSLNALRTQVNVIIVNTSLGESCTAHVSDALPKVIEIIDRLISKLEDKQRERQADPGGQDPIRPEDEMNNEQAIEAVELCDRILSMCDEVPERGEDFAESIRDKVGDMREWIIENDHVTPAQLQSLGNMEAGVSSWID